MLKGILHINFADVERQAHGLNNAENVLKAAHGEAELEVICHGRGIILAVQKENRHITMLRQLMDQGVRFVACENSMNKESLRKEDLVPGFGTVPSGAAEVLRKQQEGYGYFKP